MSHLLVTSLAFQSRTRNLQFFPDGHGCFLLSLLYLEKTDDKVTLGFKC